MKPPFCDSRRPGEAMNEIITGCAGACDKNDKEDCRNCGRIREEIEQWHIFNNQARKAVMLLARHRLSTKMID